MRVIRKIANFFVRIWRVIDKFIVIPITKLILLIRNKLDKSGKEIERWLSKSNTLLFVSLFLAVVVFISIDQKILTFSDSSAEVLKNVPVQVNYNEEAYVVEGLPETVDITLIGRRSEIMFAKRSSVHNVTIDLTGLKPGTHRVNINYHQELSTIDYSVNPSVATVIIYPKISEIKTLTVDLLNKDSLSDKLVINNVKIEDDQVVIKGAEHILKKVATVKALVDINNLVKQEVGVTTLRDIPLRAYDERGNVVDVEIVPSTISANIEIASPQKELPIKVIPVGEVAFGLAISSIEVSETKVTVYGEESVLANLNYIPIEVDVNNIKNDFEYKTELTVPVGVKSMSIKNVVVKIRLDESVSREIENVNIEYRNLNEQYSVQGLTKEDTSISVMLRGVKSVIESISSDDVLAYLDLAGYGEGTHEVDVYVVGSDVKVQYVAKTKKVKIKISKK